MRAWKFNILRLFFAVLLCGIPLFSHAQNEVKTESKKDSKSVFDFDIQNKDIVGTISSKINSLSNKAQVAQSVTGTNTDTKVGSVLRMFDGVIYKTSDLFLPLFIKKETPVNSNVFIVNSIEDLKGVSKKTSISSSSKRESVSGQSVQTPIQIRAVSGQISPIVKTVPQLVVSKTQVSNTSLVTNNTLELDILRNILSRVRNLELNQKDQVLQQITNNYITEYASGGSSYTVPSDVTPSITRIVSETFNPIQERVVSLEYTMSNGGSLSGGTSTVQAMIPNSYIRPMISSSATGLSYDNSTGVFSLTSGYTIPLTASTTEWANRTASQWTTTGSDIYYTTGNVGVGSTTPAAKLVVTGTAGVTSDVFTVASSTNTPLFSVSSGGKVSVGSGVSTQSSRFTIFSDRSDDAIVFRDTASSSNARIFLSQPLGAVGTAHLNIVSDRITFTGIVRATNIEPNGSNLTLGNGANNLTLGNASTISLVSNVANTVVFRGGYNQNTLIRPYSNAFNIQLAPDGGNVGIATTTPGFALTVGGDINLTGALRANGDAGTSGMVLQSTGAGIQWVATSSLGIGSNFGTSSARASLSVSGNILTYNNSTGVFGFSTSSLSTSDIVEGSNQYFTNTRADTRADLRIGVATTTIQNMIPNSYIRPMISSSATGLSYDNSTGVFSLTSGYTIPLTASTTEWANRTASQWTTVGSDIAYATGKVLIGTTTASTFNLDVRGTYGSQLVVGGAGQAGTIYLRRGTDGAAAASLGYTSAGEGGALSLTSGGGGGAITLNASGGSVSVVAANAAHSVFHSNGNFGVGTSTPIAKLSITGTSGSVNDLFTIASSSNARFFTINSSGNVGIATTTPGFALTVAGDINLTGALRANGDAGTSGMVLQSTGAGIQWVATSSLGISGGGSSQWTTTGSDIYYTTGNVGVGSTTPAAKLVVTGTAGVTSDVFTVASSTNVKLFTVTSSGNVGIGTSTITALLDVQGSLNAGTSRGINLVGDSNTDGVIGGAGGPIVITAGNSAGGDRAGGAVTITAGKAGQTNGAGGAITITGGIGVGTGSGGALNLRGGISGAGGSGGAIIFSTAPTTTITEVMRITPSGNVGIGTSSPVTMFAVAGNSTITGSLNLGNNTGAYISSLSTSILAASSSAQTIYIGGAGSSTQLAGQNTAVGFQSLQNITASGALNTALGYRAGLSVTSGVRNVAIGANAFDAGSGPDNVAVGYDALTAITSSISNTSIGAYSLNSLTSGNYNIAIGMRAGNNQTSGDGNIVIGSGSSGNGISAPSNGSSYTLNIGGVLWGTNMNTVSGSSIAAGNIGVGTSTPVARLAITGASGATTELLRLASSTNSGVFTVAANGDTNINSFNGLSLTSSVSSGIVMTLRSVYASGGNITVGGTGNVGFDNLANTNYGSFQITQGGGNVSNIFTEGTQTFAFRQGATASVLRTYNTYTSASNYERGALSWNNNIFTIGTENSGAGTARSLAFMTASTTRMTIDSTGNIGIGTSTPTSKLAIAEGSLAVTNTAANVGVSLAYTGASGREYQILSCFNCGSAGLGGLEVYDSTAAASRAYIQAGVNGWQTPSDMRLKDQVETLSVLDKIDQVRGASYILKDSGVPQIGVIAQEIKAVFPNAVSGEEVEGKYLGVSYNAIASIALQGVRELNDVFKSLRTQVNQILSWFGDSGQRFNVQGMVCVDDVCVTKDQFKQMLLNSGSVTYSVPNTISNATGTNSSESTTTSIQSEASTSESSTQYVAPQTEPATLAPDAPTPIEPSTSSSPAPAE